MFEKILTVLKVFVIGLALFLVGYSAIYGHLTQKETIVVQVINKDTYITTTQNCTSNDKTTTCIPMTITHYRVYGKNEEFGISHSDYQSITVGKKHVFFVTGWEGSRYIQRILE